MLAKPSFPPGWVLPDGAKILKRMDKQQFVEVFSLDNGEYLYLFHEAEIEKKLKNRNFTYESFSINGAEIAGKRYSDYKEGDISERIKNLVQRRGLDAIAGMTELKSSLIRDIIQPFLNWEAYEKYGVTPSNGVLLFGPPGCGKTFIAKKLAEAMRAELLELSEGTIGSPYIRNFQKHFKSLSKSRADCAMSFFYR
jgi:transitional endoplasmic reticulum ATPase